MSNDYWVRRALENEAKAQRLAASTSKRQAKLFKEAYDDISSSLDKLALSIMNQNKYGLVSRSDLWQYKKYTELMEVIAKTFSGISSHQISMLDSVLSKIFEDTIGSTLEAFGNQGNVAYTIYNENQLKQLLNSAWSGKNYSQRIWDVEGTFVERIKKDMTDMIIQGKNTELIKKRLMKDLNISYNYADRLVRTEASHIYNSAAMAGYKQSGVQEVKVLVERDEKICDACAALVETETKGVYRVGQEPMLPLHPRCRCCYAPIVDLDAQKFLEEHRGNDG